MQAKSTPKRVRVEGVPNLYRRPKDGKYELGYTGSDGKWHIRTLAGKSLTEAKMSMRAAQTEVDERRDVAPSKESLTRVANDLFTTMREEVTFGVGSIRTVELYEQRYRSHVEQTLGSRKVQTVTSSDVAKVLRAARAKGLSSWTVHGILTMLGAIFNHARDEMNLVSSSPTHGLSKKQRPTPTNKQQVRVLTSEEVAKLIAGAWPTWRVFVTTAAYTGARASEILGLRWRDIDTTVATVSISQQIGRGGELVPLKTAGSVRTLRIGSTLTTALREHRMASRYKGEDDFVFSTDSGRTVGYQNARRAFMAAVARAGLTDSAEGRLSLHSLRHTCASAMIRSGEDVVRVSRFLGHSKPSITLDLYADLFNEQDSVGMVDPGVVEV
jgi:integrase